MSNEANHKAVSADYGRRARGVPKAITPEDRERRSRQMKALNEQRKAAGGNVQVARGTVVRTAEVSRGILKRKD